MDTLYKLGVSLATVYWIEFECVKMQAPRNFGEHRGPQSNPPLVAILSVVLRISDLPFGIFQFKKITRNGEPSSVNRELLPTSACTSIP